MGQKVHPNGFRVGVSKKWNSRWYADKQTYGDWLVKDQQIKTYVKNRCRFAQVDKVEIERTNGLIKVLIHSARPGIIIGKKGSEVEKLNKDLAAKFDEKISVDIKEVANPKQNAQLVAMGVADQLERRVYFRRAMNKAVELTIEDNCKGVKILLSGRLGGAEMARSEKQVFGSLPLGTLDVDIDYGFAEATTTYGQIGVKVWINKGTFASQEQKEGK